MLGHGAIGQFAIGEAQLGETPVAAWYPPFAIPVMTTAKRAAIARMASGQYFVKAAPFPETVTESRWHQPWSQPVSTMLSLRRGLAARYQQTLAFWPKPLPTPTVLITMDAAEVNNDIANLFINVYDARPSPPSQEGASAAIVEEGSEDDPWSVGED